MEYSLFSLHLGFEYLIVCFFCGLMLGFVSIFIMDLMLLNQWNELVYYRLLLIFVKLHVLVLMILDYDDVIIILTIANDL